MSLLGPDRDQFVAAEETTAAVERDYQFGGEQATVEVAAKVCPECGEVTPL